MNYFNYDKDSPMSTMECIHPKVTKCYFYGGSGHKEDSVHIDTLVLVIPDHGHQEFTSVIAAKGGILDMPSLVEQANKFLNEKFPI
jgi:hypothetical protein